MVVLTSMNMGETIVDGFKLSQHEGMAMEQLMYIAYGHTWLWVSPEITESQPIVAYPSQGKS